MITWIVAFGIFMATTYIDYGLTGVLIESTLFVVAFASLLIWAYRIELKNREKDEGQQT